MEPAETASEAAAGRFADALVALRPGTSEFQRRIGQIEDLGRKPVMASTALCRDVLEARDRDRPPFRAALERLGDCAKELAKIAAALRPDARATLTDAYFDRYLPLEPPLGAVVAGLAEALANTRRHRLGLETDVGALTTVREQLAMARRFAAALDRELTARADQNNGEAALRPIRSRHDDLTFQLTNVDHTIAALFQLAAAIGRLADAIESAQRETAYALQTAVLAARQLSRQRVIIDHIRAESAAVARLVGSSGQARAQLPKNAQEQLQVLAVCWRNVERAAAAVQALRAGVDGPV